MIFATALARHRPGRAGLRRTKAQPVRAFHQMLPHGQHAVVEVDIDLTQIQRLAAAQADQRDHVPEGVPGAGMTSPFGDAPPD